MQSFIKQYWPSAAVLAFIVIILGIALAPYKGNITALFHMDHFLADQHEMPKDFVVLDIPSYDGAQYYQMARNMPKVFDTSRWHELRERSPGSYAYQRFLLPLLAYMLALGTDAGIPYAFLFINVASLLAAAFLVFRYTGKWLPAIALGLSPAAMVGLHFSIAEPLTILLLTAFLIRYAKHATIGWVEALLLSLAVLTREVNILFTGLVLLHVLWNKQWKSLAWLALPFLSFGALHGWIHLAFGEDPFLMSADKRTLPFEAMFQLIVGGYGYNRLTLTSIPLAVLFVLPALAWSIRLFWKNTDRSFLAWGTIAFLLLMTTMPDHIWGSITSIGRVITPIYPFALLLAAKRPSTISTILTIVILVIGLGAAFSLASVVHPFSLS